MNDFETIFAAGSARILNCLPSSADAVKSHPKRTGPLPPTSEIKLRWFRPAWLKIKDQDGYGACVGHGSTRAVEFVRALGGQDGGPSAWQELSAWDLYARLCGGIDRGASILDALTMLEKEGVALMMDVPYGTIRPSRIAAKAVKERLNFRVELGEQLESFEAIAWAVADGDGVSFSVHAGGGFSRVDDEGVPNYRRGMADHCVFAGGELIHSEKWGLLVGCDNSWTDQWGMNGRFRLCDAMIQAQSYFEAFRVRCVVESRIDGEDPPLVESA